MTRARTRSGNRAGRRLPAMTEIRRYWDLGPVPVCVRCGRARFYLEKAHLIDRFAGGLDIPCNLAPLCGQCHDGQPLFRPGDEEAALEWFGLPPWDSRRCPLPVLASLASALCGEVTPARGTFLWFYGYYSAGQRLPKPHRTAMTCTFGRHGAGVRRSRP